MEGASSSVVTGRRAGKRSRLGIEVLQEATLVADGTPIRRQSATGVASYKAAFFVGVEYTKIIDVPSGGSNSGT